MDVSGPPRHTHIKRFFKWMFLLILLVAAYVGYCVWTSPKLSGKAIAQNQSTTEFLDANGKVFYSNDTMPLKKVSHAQFDRAKTMKNALLSVEDRDFYSETGTNPKRIAGAAYHDVRGMLGLGGNSLQGASTLTQQLIKVSYFSTKAKDRTIKRKVQEIYLAERLNHEKSKDQILYAYFNKVYLGNGIHGMQTAAQYYFHKNVDQLNSVEAATIAGMVQSPTYYDPYRRPKVTKERRNTVLYTMYDNHKLSKKEFKQGCQVPLKASMPTYRTQIDQLRNQKKQKLNNDYYVSAVNSQLRDVLGHDGNDAVMKIQTPFQPAIQQAVNDAINKQRFPSDHLQTAVVVINNHTGQVVALNGGRLNSQQVVGGYNRAITASRSSGSAIKPLLDYAPAFDLFKMTPSSTVDDSAYDYPGTHTSVHDWDNKYQGSITARRALVGSRNVPSVKNFVRVGIDKERHLLDLLDMSTKNVYAPLAIGTNVSPLSITDGYTALANGGVKMTPQFINSIQYRGQSLNFKSRQVPLYSAGSAYMTTDILKGMFSGEGTAAAAKIDSIVQAGKTGAADGGASMPKDALTDAWFVGYTPTYTVGVWTGYDNPYNKNEYLKTDDEEISQQIYKKIMEVIIKQPGYDKKADFIMPGSVAKSGSVINWTNGNVVDSPFTKTSQPSKELSVNGNLDSFFDK